MQDSYNSGLIKSKIVMSSSSGGSVLSRDKGLRQPQLTSMPTNLLSSSSSRLKECMHAATSYAAAVECSP